MVHAVPGRANVIAGQTGIFRTSGRTAEAMTLRFPAGMLVNLGEMPKQSYPGKLPTTRMGTASLVRNALAQAQTTPAEAGLGPATTRSRPANAKLEALGLALDGKVPVIFAAHRADDLQRPCAWPSEFKLKARLDLATEGYLMADALAEAKVPVVVHPTMQRAGSMETYQQPAGQRGGAGRGTRFRWPSAPASRATCPRPGCCATRRPWPWSTVWATTAPCRLSRWTPPGFWGSRTGWQHRGGQVADLVLYDGDPANPGPASSDPFEHTTHVSFTIIQGRIVWDRKEYLKLPYARRALPLVGGGAGVGCCLGW